MRSWPAMLPLVAFVVIFGTMGLEALRSAGNEQQLRDAGGRVVPDPSYPWMRVGYPGGFLAVCLEGWWRGGQWDHWVALGVVLFVLGKILKYLAIATLGVRWTFRVIAMPDAPLVGRGVYRVLRHPNYVGVLGEIVGSALWMRAPITGTLFAVTFGLILLVRIRVEERVLDLAPRA